MASAFGMQSLGYFFRLGMGLLGLGVSAISSRADLADDLARIATEASGGAKAIQSLASWRAVGETRIGERSIPFILYVARPRSVRIETVGEMGSLVRAFDGVHVPWKKTAALKPPLRLGPEEERLFVQEAEFDPPFFNYRARRISLDYAGETVISGRNFQTILATLNFSEVTKLYLDDKTHLLILREVLRKQEGREVRMVTLYSDYRSVAGVFLPHRIRVEAEGRLMHETVIESYDANPEIPEGFFSPPVDNWSKW